MEEKQGDTPTKQHCCNNQFVIKGKKSDISQPNNIAVIINIIITAHKVVTFLAVFMTLIITAVLFGGCMTLFLYDLPPSWPASHPGPSLYLPRPH